MVGYTHVILEREYQIKINKMICKIKIRHLKYFIKIMTIIIIHLRDTLTDKHLTLKAILAYFLIFKTCLKAVLRVTCDFIWDHNVCTLQPNQAAYISVTISQR